MASKVTFQRSAMVKALKGLKRIAGTRTTLPILNWARIELSEQLGSDMTISRAGCDLKSFTKVKVPAFGSEFGAVIHAQNFLKQVESLPKGEILFELNGTTTVYTLTSGNIIFNGILKQYDDYPKSPAENPLLDKEWKYEWEMEAICEDFNEFMSFTLETSSMEMPKNYTSGVMLGVRKNQRTIVSTDGRRLHVIPIDGKVKGADKSFLVPAKEFSMLTRMQFGKCSEIRFGIVSKKDENKYFIWNCDEYEGTFSLLDTPYPDYEKVFPQPGVKIRINPEQMLECLKPIKVIANEQDGRDMVVIEVKDNILQMTAKAESVGKVEAKTECEFIGCPDDFDPKIRVALNCDYLIPTLKASKTGIMTMENGGSLEPIQFEYGEGCDWVSIVMPVRLPD